jgi:hypothetical protein
MKCETCFWFSIASERTVGICDLEQHSVAVGLDHRCSQWRFSGKECCGNCRNHVNDCCLLNGPYYADSTLEVSENDWCGQFKGRMV